jgi:hypothetical protein
MARHLFGGGIADWTFGEVDGVDSVDDLAQLVGAAVVTFYNAETGGSQYTDLQDLTGSAITQVESSDGTDGRSLGQIPPLYGPDAVTVMWAQAASGPRALMRTTDDIAADPGTSWDFSLAGAVTVGTGAHRVYNDSTETLEIAGVRATVGTVSSSGSVICDVHRNGTTIFTTQANRPTITSGQNTSGKVTNMDVTSLAPGDYLTVDIDADGTGAEDLVVQILTLAG